MNMEPGNGPLENEIPIGNQPFSGSTLNLQGINLVSQRWHGFCHILTSPELALPDDPCSFSFIVLVETL